MSTANWQLQLEKMKLLKLAMRTLYFSFLCFLIFCSLESTVSSETEILKQGEVVNSSTSLVSSNKTFTLGFLILDERNNYSYLAIWYTNNSMIRYPVWIGNRNEPIHNNSGVLTIDSSGRLIIKHNRGNVVLSAEQTTLDTTATLQESGSFVLSEVSSNGSLIRELWNSFDYPTDTLLPGMKLGIKHKTGKNWSLTSWQNPITPAPGAFTLEWDPLRRRLVIRRRGVIYWTSGGLEKGEFPHIRTEFLNRNYKFSTLRNADKEYFSYSLIYDELTSIERRTISGWQLDSSGSILDGDRPNVAYTGNCYGYKDEAQQSSGCELWKQPKCRKPGQKFQLRSGGFMVIEKPLGPRYAKGTKVGNSSFSLSDCRAECWNDCNCVGYDSYVYSTGCTFWRGKNLNFSQDISGMAKKYYVITEVTEPQSKFLTDTISFIQLLNR
ncbi:G-type lectin S-receptor-like serine/threonine-protein kinase At1g67520 [Lycium ferocissimum]|uniref:G-type lectin S-receptor-like serine/threonine-protein kinase At1g67520 n=1 Tax=Lycium ferocissimum TaxID=112874 RepID=UPI002814B3A3|nr:G-type lectin S-receptor-like serine/threonine-protein kinase At1g67520 [Lycium ferocissimum]